MKTYWLTIGGLVVLTLVALFVAKAFWISETEPVAESQDTSFVSQTQPETQQPEVKQPKPKPIFDPNEVRLIKIADEHGKQIFKVDPNIAEAVDVRELLRSHAKRGKEQADETIIDEPPVLSGKRVWNPQK